MRFENTEVWGFEHALRGMRNPKNSWNKSDTVFGTLDVSKLIEFSNPNEFKNGRVGDLDGIPCYIVGKSKPQALLDYIGIGKNDMKLAQSLIKAGSEHRKFMRQIFVSVDITAPLYWWKEFDTYKVGTVANSTSTMHKLTSQPITMDCFEIDDYNGMIHDDNNELIFEVAASWSYLIDALERLRQAYIRTKDKRVWKELIRLLPESWLQTRTVTMNYENLLAMCSSGQRRFHKLNEWSGKDDKNLSNFISWARALPYAGELIFIDEVCEECE